MLTIARWLGPQETGMFGIALLTITAIEQFSETGLRTAIIQRKGSINSYILPTRTIQVIRGLVLGALVYLCAGPIARFFSCPEAISLLQALAVVPFIRGLEPLSFTVQQKHLNFGPTVIAQISSSVLGFIVGVAVAIVYPTAWAQVAATVIACATTSAISTFLTERRLLGITFDFRALKDLHNYSRWIFANSIASYIFIRGSDWIVAKIYDPTTLALYQLAFLLTTTVTSELGGIAGQLVLPIFSGIQEDKTRVATMFVRSFGALSLVTFFVATATIACSGVVTKLFLGPNWIGLIPLVPALAIWGALSVFSSAMAAVYQGLGKPRQWTATVILMTVMFAFAVYPTAVAFGTRGSTILLVLIGAGSHLFRCMFIARSLAVPFSRIANHLILPALACLIATLGTHLLLSHFPQTKLPGEFAVSLLVSCGLFFGTVAAGQFLMQPSPAEAISPFLAELRHLATRLLSLKGSNQPSQS